MFMNLDKNVPLLKIPFRPYEYFQGKLLKYARDTFVSSFVIEGSVGLQSVQWSENPILYLLEMELEYYNWENLYWKIFVL